MKDYGELSQLSQISKEVANVQVVDARFAIESPHMWCG